MWILGKQRTRQMSCGDESLSPEGTDSRKREENTQTLGLIGVRLGEGTDFQAADSKENQMKAEGCVRIFVGTGVAETCIWASGLDDLSELCEEIYVSHTSGQGTK